MTFDWENEADPLRSGFGSLRLLNEEFLALGTGFILQTPRDLIVVTYVHEGLIVSNGPIDKPGMVVSKEFRMDVVGAGTKRESFGVSYPEETHFFQSGFNPREGPLKKGEDKKLFTHAERKGVLRLVASPDGRDSSIPIQQDALIYSTCIYNGNHMIHELLQGRKAWLHVVSGEILMNGLQLKTGDGIGLSDEISVSFTAKSPSEILLFDMADPD